MKLTEQIKTAFSKILDEATGGKSKDFIEKAKQLFEEGQVAMTEMKQKDGTVLKIEGEMKEGAKVMQVDAANGEVPATDGDHELEDGTIISVKDGMIAGVTAPIAQNKFIDYLSSEKYLNKEIFADGKDYPFDECIANAMKEYGDEETAKKVCAAIKNRTVAHAIENKFAADPKSAIALIAEGIKNNPLYAYALSVLSCKDCGSKDNTNEEELRKELELMKSDNEKLTTSFAAQKKELREMKEVSKKMLDVFSKLEETPIEEDKKINQLTFKRANNLRTTN